MRSRKAPHWCGGWLVRVDHMTGKPTPSVRDTARSVDRIFANLEARKAELARAVTVVRNIKAVPKKRDTMPDLVKRR